MPTSSLPPGDALGQIHPRIDAPPRIVSLVPSLTELLFDLGLGECMVGRTGFCVHPAPQVRAVVKVGGTKDVQLDRLAALHPTHVLVNIDENPHSLFAPLQALGARVIVTHPLRVDDNLPLYRLLGQIFAVEACAEDWCARLCTAQAALAALHTRPVRRVLYCVWRDPWMSIAPDTYIADMLSQAGLLSWCAPDPARYPAFDWAHVPLAPTPAGIDAVLLCSEPYRFTAGDATALAAHLGRPVLIADGEYLGWYGSRAVAGLEYLHRLRSAVDTALT